MSDDHLSVEEYLAKGGVLSAPGNAPPRYRGELMRLMASFVDSELAGSAGFAAVINEAPGIAQRIAAARIVAEKAAHAGRVLEIMGEFGADTARYATRHPWEARLPRDADIGARRHGGDMRLSVFHYPLQGWTDAVAMNALMGMATVVQLTELARVSYAPLAQVFRAIAPREEAHAEEGLKGLTRIVADEGTGGAQAALDYWRPRVAASFGRERSERFERLARMGLRHAPNETLLADWQARAAARLAPMGLR
jgi:1,2-phenylacetyl-CoA epoxidase catalytic subunit